MIESRAPLQTGTTLDDETLQKLILMIRDDRILVRPEVKKQAIVQGLVLPDTFKENQFEVSPFLVGRVLMCGPGMAVQGHPTARHPMDVKPGDRILHHKAARDQLFINGEGFLVIGNRDVSMVLGEDAEVIQIVHKKNS